MATSDTPDTPDSAIRPASKDDQPEESPAKEETQQFSTDKDITMVDWVEPAKKKKSKKSKKPKSKRGKVGNYT